MSGIIILTGMNGETINGNKFSERFEYFFAPTEWILVRATGVKRHTSPHAHFSQCTRVPPLIALACMAQDERRRKAHESVLTSLF